MPKISQLNPLITPLSGKEVIVLNQNGVTYNTELNTVTQFISATTKMGELSSNLNNLTTLVRVSSGDWENTHNSVHILSGNWQNASTITQASSANWNSTATSVRALSSGWQNASTTVQSSSANWNSAFTDTTNATSLSTPNTLVRRDSSGSARFNSLSAITLNSSGTFNITSPTLGSQFFINNAGVVTIGSWQGSAIGVAFGGTGATTAYDARVNLGIAHQVLSNGDIIPMVGNNVSNSSLGRSIIAGGTINALAVGADESVIGGGVANEVRSSRNVIGGGTANITNGQYAAVVNGLVNAVTGEYGAILNGNGNTATASFSIVLNGSSNTSAGFFSVIGNGIGNTTNGNYTMIGNGINNITSGSFSIICGGSSNISSGTTSFIGNGVLNTASGTQSVIGGGAFNTASGTNSTVLGGINGVASLFGEDARSSGRFTADGDAQVRRFILRNITSTTRTVASLFLDGVSSQLVIPPNTTWLYEIRVVGRSVQSINSSSFVFQGMIERSPLTTTLLGATRNTIANDWNPAFNPTLTVSSNGIVTITTTQDLLQAGEIYWVAYAEIVQVTVPGTVPSYS